MKENIEYYRHFSGADQHPKFEMLRAKYGWAGDGKFWALNNRIALASNCVLDLSKKYVKASIANALDFTLDEFDVFVIYLLEECDLIIETGSGITTNEVQENYGKVSLKRMKNKAGYVKKPTLKTAESSTKLAETENQPTGMQIQLSENIQTKVNKSKVNKSKVNKREEVEIILNDLNERLGLKKGFSADTEKSQSLILSRLRDGFSVEDFFTVNEKKINSWKTDPNMCKFLRPETLYGNKFEGYLNEIIVSDNDALRFNQSKQGKKPSTKERLADAWAEMGVDPENNSLVKPETGESNADSTGVEQGVNVIEFGLSERRDIKRLN